MGAGLFQPIFQGGRITRNYEAAQARFDQALAQYQKAALNGYREVADSLVTIQKLGRGAHASSEEGVVALRDAAQLSRSRYDTGLSNYLEILIADQQLFEQELAARADARRRAAGVRAALSRARRRLAAGAAHCSAANTADHTNHAVARTRGANAPLRTLFWLLRLDTALPRSAARAVTPDRRRRASSIGLAA